MDSTLRKIIGLAAVTAALAFPAVATAHTTVIEPPGSHFPYQRWIDEAKVPTPDVTITVVEAPCPSGWDRAAACTAPGLHTIWMSVASPALREEWPRADFLHEIGHNFDAAYLTPALRHSFRVLHGGTRRHWFDRQGRGWGLEEAFAANYMSCALGPTRFFEGERWSRYEPAACRLIDNAYAAASRAK